MKIPQIIVTISYVSKTPAGMEATEDDSLEPRGSVLKSSSSSSGSLINSRHAQSLSRRSKCVIKKNAS